MFKKYRSPIIDLHLSISNGFVSSKVHDKRDDFDFDIVNFTLLDGDVPRYLLRGLHFSIDELENLHADRTSVCFDP